MESEVYEKKVIGGIVSGAVSPSGLGLDGADFSDPELAGVFRIARQLESEKVPLDAGILAQRVAQADIGYYTEADFELMARSARSASVAIDAAERIRAVAMKGFLLERLASLAGETKKSGPGLLESVRMLLADAERDYARAENNFVFLKDLKPKLEAVYGDLHAGVSYAVPSYFPQMDQAIGDGFSKGDLHIICGFTGQGKSALALNCARFQAQRGHVVGVVSREMSDIENVIRLQSSDLQLPRWRIRKEMFDLTHQDLVNHLEKFAELPIAFDTVTDDVEILRPQVRRMVEQHGMEVLYVDYLQLMSSSSNRTRAEEVASVSRTLKLIAMECRIPVVALCQFNRGAVQASVFDLLSYLKESSGIEQDASTITYVTFEKSDSPSEYRDGRVVVLKNRNGASFATVPVRYKGETFTFYEQGSGEQSGAAALGSDWSTARRDLA